MAKLRTDEEWQVWFTEYQRLHREGVFHRADNGQVLAEGLGRNALREPITRKVTENVRRWSTPGKGYDGGSVISLPPLIREELISNGHLPDAAAVAVRQPVEGGPKRYTGDVYALAIEELVKQMESQNKGPTMKDYRVDVKELKGVNIGQRLKDGRQGRFKFTDPELLMLARKREEWGDRCVPDPDGTDWPRSWSGEPRKPGAFSVVNRQRLMMFRQVVAESFDNPLAGRQEPAPYPENRTPLDPDFSNQYTVVPQQHFPYRPAGAKAAANLVSTSYSFQDYELHAGSGQEPTRQHGDQKTPDISTMTTTIESLHVSAPHAPHGTEAPYEPFHDSHYLSMPEHSYKTDTSFHHLYSENPFPTGTDLFSEQTVPAAGGLAGQGAGRPADAGGFAWDPVASQEFMPSVPVVPFGSGWIQGNAGIPNIPVYPQSQVGYTPTYPQNFDAGHRGDLGQQTTAFDPQARDMYGYSQPAADMHGYASYAPESAAPATADDLATTAITNVPATRFPAPVRTFPTASQAHGSAQPTGFYYPYMQRHDPSQQQPGQPQSSYTPGPASRQSPHPYTHNTATAAAAAHTSQRRPPASPADNTSTYPRPEQPGQRRPHHQ